MAWDTEDGTELDIDLVNKMLELSGTIAGGPPVESERFISNRKDAIKRGKLEISEENKQYYLAERDKLNGFLDDLKRGLEQEIDRVYEQIREIRRDRDARLNGLTVQEVIAIDEQINALEKKRNKMRNELNKKMDMLDAQNEHLLEEIRKKLDGKMFTEPIMTIGFEIV